MAGVHTNTQIAYGIKVLPKGDPYIAMAEKAIASAAIAATPGAFLVDVLPICALHSPILPLSHQIMLVKHVPEWVPGAGFKTKARLCRKLAVDMVVAPFEAAKQAIVSSVVFASFSC
jgi:hypothetical protein